MEKINDVLGRSEDAETVARFATARATGPEGLVLNVDAAWGMGKTTFLRLLKERLGDDAVMVNAWESDFADDPLLPVLKAVTEALRSESGPGEAVANSLLQKGSRMALTIGKGMAKQVGRKMIGEAVEEVAEQIGETGAEITEAGLSAALDDASAALMARFETQQKTVADFKKALIEAVKDRDTPLHILIDELDRCRPTYAIEMLERIKHLFGVKNVAFVIATDTEQLQHSIRAVYGEGFDAKAYLRRFFDRTYRFDEPDEEAYAQHLFDNGGVDIQRLPMPWRADPVWFFGSFSHATGLTLRDMEQCFAIIETITSLWDEDRRPQLTVLLPFVFLHHRGDVAGFEALASGDVESEHLVLDRYRISFREAAIALYGEPRDEASQYDWWPICKAALQRAHAVTTIIGQQPSTMAEGEAFRIASESLVADPDVAFPRSAQTSLLLRYPKLVRQAGRMKVLD